MSIEQSFDKICRAICGTKAEQSSVSRVRAEPEQKYNIKKKNR